MSMTDWDELERMTLAQYAKMKSEDATTAGRPIRRLSCSTIHTATISDLCPALQWFWFEDDDLLSLVSSPTSLPPEKSTIEEFESTLSRGPATRGTTTVIVPERSDLNRLLGMVADKRMRENMQTWANLPVSRRLVVLTEALTRRYWAPSGVDTSKFADWVGAFDVAGYGEKSRDLESLTQKCLVRGYSPRDAPHYLIATPQVSKGFRWSHLLDELDRTPHDNVLLRHLYMEQITQAWAAAEFFDPINIEQSLCTGSVAVFATLGRQQASESGWVHADAGLPFDVGEEYWLLSSNRSFNLVEVTLAEAGCVENHGDHDARLVRVSFPCRTQVFNPLLIARPSDDLVEGGYVADGTMTFRWTTALPHPLGIPEAPVLVPVDVVLAGAIT